MRWLRDKIKEKLEAYWKKTEALAVVEAAMIFPVLLTLLLGVFDMGNAILANQKAIRASQVAADLISRERSVSDAELNQAFRASELAIHPFSANDLGIEIISFSFDDAAQPVIEWRETRNTTAAENPEQNVQSLAIPGEGVVMVIVRYDFEPFFAGFVIDQINMLEMAFSRGRSVPVVARD